MANGFEFELSNGNILQVVPSSGASECAISHGDTKIEIDVERSSFKALAPAGKEFSSVSAVVRFEVKDITVDQRVSTVKIDNQPHIMRTCSDCHGQACCATNACVNCGCGWVCG